MYFSAGLKMENAIYLIECLSRCLIMIHVPSGKSMIEVYLPWKFTEKKIRLVALKRNLIIYSPAVEHLLVYDCLKKQISTIELQENQVDKAGFYYSNILIYQDDLIVLPYKGKEIKRYGVNGLLKFKDKQWCSLIARECESDENLFENIRTDSACIVGEYLFFSLVYENQNYLCRYELNQEEHLCTIIYCSGNIAIRGVYAYPNMVLFRRIFYDKTELVMILLDSGKQQTFEINCPSMFEEDVYGNIHHIRGVFNKKIIEIRENNLGKYSKIYKLGQQEIYIENGILFDSLKNEILVSEAECIKKYLIGETIREIKSSHFYYEGYRSLFYDRCTGEGRYKLCDMINYLTLFPIVLIKDGRLIKNKTIGEWVWEML